MFEQFYAAHATRSLRTQAHLDFHCRRNSPFPIVSTDGPSCPLPKIILPEGTRFGPGVVPGGSQRKVGDDDRADGRFPGRTCNRGELTRLTHAVTCNSAVILSFWWTRMECQALVVITWLLDCGKAGRWRLQVSTKEMGNGGEGGYGTLDGDGVEMSRASKNPIEKLRGGHVRQA